MLCSQDPSRAGCPEVTNPIPPDTNCQGGGGSGGRVAIYYTKDEYTGTILAYGGKGFECGGAGTIIKKDTDLDKVYLEVDNNNVCVPKGPSVSWNTQSDTNRGQTSFLTWLYDQDGTNHSHVFEVSCLVVMVIYTIMTVYPTLKKNVCYRKNSKNWHT